MLNIKSLPQWQSLFVSGSIFLLTLIPNYLIACGWWGDGELNRDTNIALTTKNGKPLPQSLTIQNSRLPGRMGYGIAILEPGLAIPYLQATRGQIINRISELKNFGFKTVIDLGTPKKEARKHQTETEALGLFYINIPIEGHLPSIQQINYFTQQVVKFSHNSLLVYAQNSVLLGTMWAAYRINLGAPIDFAIKQGKKLGMEAEQELAIRSLFTK